LGGVGDWSAGEFDGCVLCVSSCEWSAFFDRCPFDFDYVLLYSVADELSVGVVDCNGDVAIEYCGGAVVVKIGVAFVFLGLAHDVTELDAVGCGVFESDHFDFPSFDLLLFSDAENSFVNNNFVEAIAVNDCD
jgi:hypothetical protein